MRNQNNIEEMKEGIFSPQSWVLGFSQMLLSSQAVLNYEPFHEDEESPSKKSDVIKIRNQERWSGKENP